MYKILLITIPFLITLVSMSLNTLDNSLELKTFNISYSGPIGNSKNKVNNEIKINKKEIKNYSVKRNKTSIGTETKDVENLDFSISNIKAEKNTTYIDINKTIQNKILKHKNIKKKIIEYSIPKKDIIHNNKDLVAIVIKKNKNELNINEPVQLYGFHNTKKIEKSNWSRVFKLRSYELEKVKMAKPQIARTDYYENEETIIRVDHKKEQKNKTTKIDRISTALSATEKSDDLKPLSKISEANIVREQKVDTVTKSKVKNEDLVFFDYSADEVKPDDKSIVAKKIAAVMAPIKKSKPKLDFNNLYDRNKKPAIADIKAPKVAINIPDETNKNEYSLVNNKMNSQKNMNGFMPPIEKKKIKNKKKIADYSIQTYSVTNKKVRDHRNFEIRFEDDIDDIRQDFGEGIINLTEAINNEMMIRRGTIYTAGHIPTTVDFVLEDNEVASTIPLLTQEYLASVLEKEKVTGSGATLLVELDEQTEDLDLDVDTAYEKKIFLDKNFNIVDRSDSEYSFIMILGVKPGNTILSFKTITNEMVSKIIHLESDEVYYDSNFYVDTNNDDFELNEESLLSKSSSPLSLDNKEILGLTFDAKIKKKTINLYELNKVKYPIGIRSYVELKHLNESIFVGRWKNKVVQVPSETYMRFVLDQFSIKTVNSQCLIQINLPKEAKELYFNGQSNSRAMRVQTRILDSDGQFYEDLSNESKKIFILGEEQGIINVKVKYTDNTVDYLQSYCSDSTYLVEQL
jgi:hypothetical protein